MVRPNHPFFGSNGIYGTVETHVNRKIIPEITVVDQLEKKAEVVTLPKIPTRRMASSANGALLYQPRATGADLRKRPKW